jgi:N6-adenosine-specific RNA methylase IME4
MSAKRKAKKSAKAKKPAKRINRKARIAQLERIAGVKPDGKVKSFEEFGRLAVQPTRKPSEIKVGNRFRIDKGDIAALAESINARGRDGKPGLIQPIAIDTTGKLIDGERRLLAWSKSKFAGQPIPVHVVDIDSIIAGEYDAEAHHKKFLPSELVAIKRAIEGRLAEAARGRQHAGRKAEGPKGSVGDQVAKMVGRDRRTVEKAEKVVEAAERDPDRFGKLKDDMDRTGRVDGPYKRLQNISRGEELRNAPPPVPMQGPYHTVVIDFPWPADLDGYRDQSARGYYPYATMPMDEIIDFCAKQIEPVLAADCAVWLWIPNFHLVRGCQLDIFKWLRVTGSTILTWAKPEIGQGQRLRGASEHAILAVRGNVPVLGTEQKTWFEAPAGGKEHSAKPAKFFEIVEAVTPAPRYAYFFAGGDLPEKWDGHGDRVGKVSPADARAAERELLDEAKAPPAAAPALPTLAEGDKSPPEDVLACLDAVQRGAAIRCGSAIGYLLGCGYVKGKRNPKLTVFGKKRLEVLRDLVRGKRADADAWGGHVVTMTIDWTAGPDNANLKIGKLGINVGTCKCGAEFRVARGGDPEENAEAGRKMEALVKEHRIAVGANRRAQVAPTEPAPAAEPAPEPEAPPARGDNVIEEDVPAFLRPTANEATA